MSTWLGLGIGLIIAGLVIVLLVWTVLRLLPRTQPALRASFHAPTPLETPEHGDAVLVIHPGGWVEYVNTPARQLFDLREDEPLDLERLVKRIRPGEDFLNLCVVEGQRWISVNGRLMEVTSYRIPGPYPTMLISLRRSEISPALVAGEKGFPGSILNIVADFDQAISSNLNLDATIKAIFDNVNKIVSVDVLEVKVWDNEIRKLIPYRFGGEIDAEHQFSKVERSIFAGYSNYLIERRQPLFVADTQSYTELPLVMEEGLYPVRSYLGVPLMAGGELVGTLEIGQMVAQAFTQEDTELLQLMAGQMAIAIRNALLFSDEQQQAAEMAGLVNLSQAIGAIKDPKDLFTRLTQSVAALFDVEILGFLLYDEDQHVLEGQVPFQGIPSHVVEIYRTTIQTDSVGEQILLGQQPVLTLDAIQDEQWRNLGLQDFAQAASLRDSALVPLVSSGRLLGYFQLSNHRQGITSFSQDEIRLVNIIANQVAVIIDNAKLVKQARQRSQRVDALRRITDLVASSATVNDVLRFSLKELARLLQADMAAIYLMDEPSGELRLHLESLWAVPKEAIDKIPYISIDDPRFHLAVTSSQRAYMSGRMSADHSNTSIYCPLMTLLNMESAIIVPLLIRNHNIGELMLGNRKADFFNNNDLQVVSTAAGQLAAMIERSSLITQTDESLRRRVDQLTTLTRVSREMGASFELKQIIQVLYEECLRLTGADCVTVLLLTLEDKSGEPRVTMSLGCPSERGLLAPELKVLQTGKPIAVGDFKSTEYQPPHEDVRSALVVPIVYLAKVIGLVHLHAKAVDRFDDSAMDIVQSLTIQAAGIIGNAQRYQEQQQQSELLRRRADTLTRLTQTAYSLGLHHPLERSLETIALGIQESTSFQVVLISVYEPDTGLLRRMTGVGMSQELFNELLTRKQPLKSLQQLLKPEFKLGRAYYIPADQTPVIPADVHYINVVPSEGKHSPNAWHPDDFLLMPLQDLDGNPLGLISLDSPRDNLRPDLATIETLETFAAQASLAIDSYSRLSDLRSRIDALSSGLQRQQKLLSMSQNDLPILLRKDLDQTISIHELDQRSQRIRAGLQISASVGRQLDTSSALLALGREILTQLGMSVALVAEDAPEGPRLLHILGNVPRTVTPEALFGQRNPLRVCLQSGKPLLVMNLDEDDEWRETPLLSALRAKGFICLPIIVENKPAAAVLAISPEPMPLLTDEDQHIYYQITRQASVVLQNISLLNETRRRLQEVNLLLDFSRQLSGLDQGDIVKALLESALRTIPAAHAGVVLLWEARNSRLVPMTASNYADDNIMMKIVYRLGEGLPGIVFSEKRSRRVDEVNFARDYPLTPENLLHYREATGGRLPVSSMLIPIQSGDQGLGVLVLDNFNAPASFKLEDETLLLSLSQQVALSIENVRLVHATQERAVQLQALTDVAATITSSLKSDELTASLLDQLRPVISYDTATLWLREREHLVVTAARGFPDDEKRLDLTVAVNDSALFNEMIRTGRSISVADVREDQRFHMLSEVLRLSWLGIPLISKSEVIGVIALEKWEAGFYTREHIQIATTFAGQAAVALENAHLYEESLKRAAELDQRSNRLALLNQFSSELSGLLEADQILPLTAKELLRALDAIRISVVIFERGKAVLKEVLPRSERRLPEILPETPLFDHLRESRGLFVTDHVRDEKDLAPLFDFLGKTTNALLILPLASVVQMHALLFVHMGGDYRFSHIEIELARTIANQATIALENARLYQSTLATAERFSILNEVSYEISSSLDPEQIYAAIHKAAKRLMPVEAFVIALLDEEQQKIDGVYLVDKDKRKPGVSLKLGDGLSGRVITTGQPMLLHGAEKVEEMGGATFGELGTPQSILAVPMTLGSKVVGMLSAQSYQSDVYTEEDQQILSTFANQAVVAIQNGRLFAETQRLAQELEQRVIERTAQLQHEQQNTETLLRILTEVSASLDLDRALNRTLALLNDAIRAEQGTIMLLYAEDNLLHYRAGYGYISKKAGMTENGFTLKVGEGLAGWIVENRQAVLVEDLHKDSHWVKMPADMQKHRSAIAAPLLVGEDVIGVLLAFHRKTNHFSPESLNLVKAIASQVAVAINNAHLYELIRDQAERLGNMLRREQEDASRSQAILKAVADGVLVTRGDNKIDFINASAENILNLKAANVVNQSLDDFGGLFGRAASTWMQTVRSWSENPSSYQPGETYAEQLELEDNRIVLVHLAPVMLQNDFLGTVSIFRDITHEVEVDRLKSEFVATVSHELRTPMTSIRGYVDLLLMGAAGVLNENQNNFLQIVKTNTERLNVLVGDLLDLSRIEAGRVVLSPQPLDLRMVAEEVIANTERQSQEEKKPMVFSLEASSGLPQIYGDAERVRQILDNLLDNAYHYTPENGHITMRIHVVDEKEVQVDVKDNGVGIAPVDQERIFERFYRGENPYILATPGTGLGLPIVKQLVEMHHGRIWMQSKGISGKGSKFSFTLPVYKADE